jgi:SMI1 / KNR4 family (SUKH-1)
MVGGAASNGTWKEVDRTMVSRRQLFAEFRGNPPASPAIITGCQVGLSFPLPPDYVHFLLRMNGGEGFIGAHYLVVWRIEELAETNKGYMVEEFTPELFLFGSNGAGEAFAFDTRFAPISVVAVPLILTLKDAVTLAPSFDAFLQHLYRSDSLLPPKGAQRDLEGR